MFVPLDLAATADRHHAAHRQHRCVRGGVDEQIDRAHRVADEMRRLDTEGLAEPRDVADPHTAAVIEVDDLRRAAEAQHVRGEHAVVGGERRNRVLPAEFRADAELAAVQQDHRITLGPPRDKR